MDEQLASQPWALQLEKLRDLCRVERKQLPLSGEDFRALAESDRDKRIKEYLGIGDPEPEDIGEGVRLIHLWGVMMKRPSVEERFFYDARDIDAFARQIAEAEADPQVRAAVINVDSPGGQVVGTPEAAARVLSFGKPLAVFTDSLMASGAYWVGSQGPAVYATPSAMVGSIGVYLPMIDVTGMLERFGVKVDLIKSGKHKAAGFPGTSLTADQRGFLQDRINAIHAEFKASVRRRRVTADESDMEGQVYSGREAAARGLVTGLVSDIGEVAAKLL